MVGRFDGSRTCCDEGIPFERELAPFALWEGFVGDVVKLSGINGSGTRVIPLIAEVLSSCARESSPEPGGFTKMEIEWTLDSTAFPIGLNHRWGISRPPIPVPLVDTFAAAYNNVGGEYTISHPGSTITTYKQDVTGAFNTLLAEQGDPFQWWVWFREDPQVNPTVNRYHLATPKLFRTG